MGGSIQLKRAYDPPEPADGWRVLVDRLWPRGVARARLALDAWAKDAAPSTELRQWFGHEPARWQEFRQRYFAELDRRPTLVNDLRARSRHGTVTLVFGARDRDHNDAVALRDYLEGGRGLEPGEPASPPCFLHELDPEWSAPTADGPPKR